jgi:hypothetical protein
MTSFCRLPTLLVVTGEGLIEMKLKEHAATWPPDMTMRDASQTPGIPPKADLADVVWDVRNVFFWRALHKGSAQQIIMSTLSRSQFLDHSNGK